jgi:membrane protease YdiL (CAAX protease family)
MITYFSNLVSFLGISLSNNTNSTITPMSFLLKSWLFIYAAKFSCFLIIFILQKIDVINIKNIGLTNWANDTSTYVFIFQVFILGPILEEILFRGILTGNGYLVSASISALVFFCIKIYYKKSFYDIDDKFFFALLISIITFVVFITIYRFTDIGVNISKLYSSNTYLRFLIVISALFFAYWHSSNFETKNLLSISLILALLPHFISGIVYSGVCLKYGIAYSIILHMSVNLLPVLQTVFQKK